MYVIGANDGWNRWVRGCCGHPPLPTLIHGIQTCLYCTFRATPRLPSVKAAGRLNLRASPEGTARQTIYASHNAEYESIEWQREAIFIV